MTQKTPIWLRWAAVLTTLTALTVIMWLIRPHTSAACCQVTIDIADSSLYSYVNRDDIADMLDSRFSLLGQPMSNIDCQQIEDYLTQHDMIKSATCYKTPSAALCITILQRSPVYRVAGQADYYVDADRTIMPVSTRTAVYVPIVTGHVDTLMATTTLDSLCCALRKLHVPSLLVTLLLLTFRYVSLLIEQVSVMTEAYHLRAPGQKGLHISAWGSFLGQLLLRTMDRAGELYDSMQLRGFTGEFPYAAPPRFSGKDAAVLILGAAVLLFLRFVNIAQLLGNLFVR